MLPLCGIQKPRSKGAAPLAAEGMRIIRPASDLRWAVGINAAIAKERPVAAGVFTFGGIAFDHEDFFFIVGRFGNGLAEGIGDEGIAPELEAGIAIGRFALEADTIYNGDINSICDRVRAWIVFQASSCAAPNSAFSWGCQPMLVG